jgi:hypothetical protein
MQRARQRPGGCCGRAGPGSLPGLARRRNPARPAGRHGVRVTVTGSGQAGQLVTVLASESESRPGRGRPGVRVGIGNPARFRLCRAGPAAAAGRAAAARPESESAVSQRTSGRCLAAGWLVSSTGEVQGCLSIAGGRPAGQPGAARPPDSQSESRGRAAVGPGDARGFSVRLELGGAQQQQ